MQAVGMVTVRPAANAASGSYREACTAVPVGETTLRGTEIHERIRA